MYVFGCCIDCIYLFGVWTVRVCCVTLCLVVRVIGGGCFYFVDLDLVCFDLWGLGFGCFVCFGLPGRCRLSLWFVFWLRCFTCLLVCDSPFGFDWYDNVLRLVAYWLIGYTCWFCCLRCELDGLLLLGCFR